MVIENRNHKTMILKKIAYFIILSPLFFFFSATGQQKFSEGKITYSVDAEDVSPQAAAAFKNSQLVFHFKNYLFRSEIRVGPTTYVNIRNGRDHSGITLINSGANKYLIRMDAEELKNESARLEGVTFQDQPGTKQIAGYTCQKAIGKLKNGNTFTVYYTQDLVPVFGDYSPRFSGLKGLPLQFEMETKSGRHLTMTATNVDIGLQPAVLFRIPTSGYRELSYEEFEKLRGRD